MTKEEINSVMTDTNYLRDSLKTFLKEKDPISDSLLKQNIMTGLRILSALQKELNLRSFSLDDKVGYEYDLLRAYKEKYPEFEDEFNERGR